MNLHPLSLFTGIAVLISSQFAFGQENLAKIYCSGNHAKVIGIANSAIASGDSSFNTFYLKALSEVQLGHTGAAIHTLQIGIENHPADVRLKKMLAGQYYEAGDFMKARKCYNNLVQTDSTDVSSWLKLAEIASFSQQYGNAIDILEQVLVIDSLNLSSLMMLGDILNKRNDSTAVAYFERAYRIHPENQKAAYALINEYIEIQNMTNAVTICEYMLDIDSTSIKFVKLTGYVHYKMAAPEKAISRFKSAVGFGDSTLFTFKYMGICQYLVSDISGAIASLQAAIEKDSMDAEVHFFLGASMANTLAKSEALFHLDRSFELMQPDPSVVSRIYSEKGNIKRLQEEYEQAYTFYNKSWEADTTNPMALYFMASILDNSLHRSEEALIDYQRLMDQLDLKPESGTRNDQVPSIRAIVEDRIISLKEELFFLDQ